MRRLFTPFAVVVLRDERGVVTARSIPDDIEATEIVAALEALLQAAREAASAAVPASDTGAAPA